MVGRYGGLSKKRQRRTVTELQRDGRDAVHDIIRTNNFHLDSMNDDAFKVSLDAIRLALVKALVKGYEMRDEERAQ